MGGYPCLRYVLRRGFSAFFFVNWFLKSLSLWSCPYQSSSLLKNEVEKEKTGLCIFKYGYLPTKQKKKIKNRDFFVEKKNKKQGEKFENTVQSPIRTTPQRHIFGLFGLLGTYCQNKKKQNTTLKCLFQAWIPPSILLFFFQ